MKLQQTNDKGKKKKFCIKILIMSASVEVGDIFFIVILAILLACIIPSNVFVSVVIVKKRLIQNPIWYYILNLVVCNLVSASFLIPIMIYASFDETILDIPWLCTVNGFFMIVLFMVSTTTLASISLHKYVNIRKPFSVLSRKDRSSVFIFIDWLISIGIASSPMIGWSHYSHPVGRKWCVVGANRTLAGLSLLALLVVVGFLIPLGVMLFCYLRIYKNVHKNVKRIGRLSVTSLSHGTCDKKLIKTVILIVGIFALCWTPFAVYAIVGISPLKTPVTLGKVACTCVFLQFAINPIVYSFRHSAFQETFYSCIRANKDSQSDTSNKEKEKDIVFVIPDVFDTKL